MADMVFSGVTFGGGFSIAYPPPPPPYFIAQGPTSGTSTGRAISIDSSGDMYEVAAVNSSAEISLSKYSVSTGLVVWQYKIDSAYNDNAYSIYIDSSDNIFIAGIAGGDLYPSNPNGQSWVGKFNTSGAIQWQTTIAAEAYGSVINQLVTDSSGNIIVAGYTPNVYGKGWVAKLNSSGAVQWLKATATESGLSGVATDSSNNIYLVGSGAARGNPGVAMKLDTNGNQLWAKTWNGNNSYANGAGGVTVSASGYVYISFTVMDPSDAYIAKLSTSDGSQVWQRKLNSGTNDYGGSLSIDSSENIYWISSVLYNYSGQVGYQNQKAVMAKYDSSGAIQWQRQMYVSGTSYPNAFDYLSNIKVDNSGNFYVAGYMNLRNILAKLPTDGTLTGTYTVNGISIIYNASSLTESAGGLGLGTGGSYVGAGTYTQSTPTYAVTATSYTTATVVIG
jgi:hypothetical protein